MKIKYIWWVVLVIILFGSAIYSTINKVNEGFGNTHTVWNEETIKSYKDYMKSIGGQDSSSMFQQSGTSEDSVKSFISTGTWKWSENVIKMFTPLKF